ncbi:hypothetical protein SLS64_009920 [Diaporthe eres]|uniref:Integral membrane protein n=1 Tax=Diaporthe eres TaxID=83184 RepID=A0ABR1P1X8_DIAER
MDFFLAIFPWFVLWELNMKRREKITVYATADSVMYTSSELMVTVICISVPTLRPLWQKALNMQSSAYKYGTGDHFDGSRYGRGTSKKQTLRSFDDGPDGATFGMDNLGTNNGTKGKGMMNVTTNVTAFSPTPSGAKDTDHSSDNDSDKEILRDVQQHQAYGDGITRTRQVTITYGSAS